MNKFTAHKAFLSRIASPSFFLFARKVNNQYSIISLIFFLIRSKVRATSSSRILQGYPLGVGGNSWPRARAIQWCRFEQSEMATNHLDPLGPSNTQAEAGSGRDSTAIEALTNQVQRLVADQASSQPASAADVCITSRHPMPDAGPDNAAPKPSPATHSKSGPPHDPAPHPSQPLRRLQPHRHSRCHRPLLRSRLAPRPPQE